MGISHIKIDQFIPFIPLILENFSLAMLILALLFVLLHKLFKRHTPESEIIYCWLVFFALGLTSIYAFVMHAFFPSVAASNIGWATSPFQYEVAIANLAIGVIAILSFNASYGFRLATVTAAVIWLWGNAMGHILQIIQFHNFSQGNAGSWLVMDIVLPFMLVIVIRQLR